MGPLAKINAQTRETVNRAARIWFAYFTESELRDCFRLAGFRIEFMERREPYDTEIENERIYTVGLKG